MSTELVSFDVFDTLLTRPSGSPESAFLMLGRRLARRGLIGCSAQAFAALRTQAEARRFANAGGLDSHVTLADIIGELVLGLDADPGLLAAEELALERALLRPLPAGVRRLREARAAGARIAFVSDMYLPMPVLERLLRANGLFVPGDTLLVSNVHAASKRSGRLFDVLGAQTGVPFARIEHHGNDAISDVARPARRGIRVAPFAQGNANRYERLLDEAAAESDGLAGSLAGASRLARNSFGDLGSHERTIVDSTAGVAAPLLIGFVLWTFRQALADGVRRLYFVSRDGQLLLAVAELLAARLRLDLELRYLYGSRQAWRAPAVDLDDPRAIASLLPGRINGGVLEAVSVEAVLARFGIQPVAIAPALSAIGLPEPEWTRAMREQEIDALHDLIRGDAGVRTALAGAQRENRARVVDYLRQEGLGDGTPSGMVDLGTGATLYNALADLLETAGLAVPRAYYLGQRRDGVPSNARIPQRYLFDAREERGFCSHAGLIGFLEAVCSADHGSVVGYRRDDRRIHAVTAADGVGPVRAWGHDRVREALLASAAHLVLHEDCVDWQADVRAATMRAFEAFWLAPTPEEARVWGAFPLDDGWAGHCHWIRLARPYSPADLLQTGFPHRHWWHEGALAQSGPVMRRVIRLRGLALKALRRGLAHLRRPSRAAVAAATPPAPLDTAGVLPTSPALPVAAFASPRAVAQEALSPRDPALAPATERGGRLEAMGKSLHH